MKICSVRNCNWSFKQRFLYIQYIVVMSKPLSQHIVPRVYLKQFQIDNEVNKSFLYCLDFSNKYNTKVQKVGLNDIVFKERKYYNDQRYSDPFTIEKMFATEVEPRYDSIMRSIREELNLSEQIREDILVYTFASQCRGQYLRWNTERVMGGIIGLQNQYEKKQLSVDEKALLESYIKESSKDIQLSIFSDKEQLDRLSSLHAETLILKQWRILKAPTGQSFLTNDNPGFSPNIIERFSAQRPFHPLMELNGESIIFYVLSPWYCLEIKPFFEGTPVELNAMNMEIKFEEIHVDYVDYINMGVEYTKFKLLISHSRSLLERYLKNS